MSAPVSGSAAAAPREPMRLGLFGAGRLAGSVLEAAGAGAAELAWQAGRGERPGQGADAAIDASLGEAVPGHLDWAIESATPLVIAATGWRLDGLRERVGERTGVVVAPNGSLTVALLFRLARVLGAYAGTLEGAGGFVLDHHHAGKRDAPSGTAIRLAEAFEQGSGVPPAVASVRAGHEVGSHVVGLDAPGEVLELHHRARSRASFALGLLEAARFLRTRRGVFTMDDVAASALAPLFASEQPTIDPNPRR